jgi:hypothetical protein
MKTKYDGTWLWLPRGRTESMLFMEWLAENGHTLGKMVVVKSDALDDEDEGWFKIYFEYPSPRLLNECVDYINKNA